MKAIELLPSSAWEQQSEKTLLDVAKGLINKLEWAGEEVVVSSSDPIQFC